MNRRAAVQKIDRRIAELEERVKHLRTIREALDDSDLVTELLDVLGVSEDEIPANEPSVPRPGNHYDTIVEFFKRRSNAWATARQIEKETPITGKSAREVMARGHADAFEYREIKNSRTREYRLKVQQ